MAAVFDANQVLHKIYHLQEAHPTYTREQVRQKIIENDSDLCCLHSVWAKYCPGCCCFNVRDVGHFGLTTINEKNPVPKEFKQFYLEWARDYASQTVEARNWHQPKEDYSCCTRASRAGLACLSGYVCCCVGMGYAYKAWTQATMFHQPPSVQMN